LSVILASLPALSGPGESSPGWVEDVGGSEVGTLGATAPSLPSVDLGSLLGPGPVTDEAARSERPKLRSYTVEAGDTLFKVATRFDLNTETLVWANELADPDLLLTGSKLVIPPAIGVLHRVRPGDTLRELAAFYGSDLDKIIEVNALDAPFVILVGQRLLMPGGKMPAPSLATEASSGDVQASRGSATLAANVEAGRPEVGSPPPKPLPYPSGASPNQARFILSVAHAARESQRETGVPASVTIAQAILETFWGSSRLSREHNNYFGIKAKERPGSAGVAWFDVWEVISGSNVIQREPFRAYNTIAESFIDHGRFFHQNRRYASALAARGDPQQFAREINRAGYATDPGYAPKLIGLMERFNLYAYDS
jgi:flagellum-specific peptidoglycan hydrolase FlgJ